MSFLMLLASAAAEPAAAVAHEAASGAGLPQMDASTFPSQIFWLIVTFGFLYLVMSSIVLPRLGGTLEERRDRIADDLDQAADFKHQAEDAEKSYNQALAEATAKARAIAADTREKLNAEIAEIAAEAEHKSAASLAAAEERIASMKADASKKVREAAIETTRAVVAALIDETPTPEAVSAAMPARANA